MFSIKKIVTLSTTLLLSAVLTSACAQSDSEAALKKLIEPKLGEGVKVTSVAKTPYSGLYEVVVEDDIFYTDAKAQYIFVGNVIDLKSHKNLTRAKLEGMNSVKFKDMPIELALKQVSGNGKRVIAIFEDPNCIYCKRIRKELAKIDNVTIYTFMYDILSEDSAVKSKNVWCSADPAAAWTDWMTKGKVPAAAPATCTNEPHQKILELGAKLKINGTPALFFEDGSRIPGFVDAAAIEEKLKSIK